MRLKTRMYFSFRGVFVWFIFSFFVMNRVNCRISLFEIRILVFGFWGWIKLYWY